MTTDLAQKQETQLAQPASESAQVLAVIKRVALDPNVDVDKMERLLDMQERVLKRNAEAEFSIAMNRAQSAMGRISADATNPQTRSKYASYGQLDRHLRPVYSENGFSLSFDTGDSEPGTVKVLCHVAHSAGHSRTYQVVMPADGKGAKGGDVMTKTHAAGAGMSYGMRYLLKLIFNVAVGEDDTDGNPPPDKPDKLTQLQIQAIEKAAKAAGVDHEHVCQKAHVGKIEDIQPDRFQACIGYLNKLKERGAK